MKVQRTAKTIRIFVSSTFADMQIERKILQEKVFKKLSAYCEKHGWQFENIDLRWGISSEASANQQTLKICMEELERCKQISPQPNFLILLGQRYGWCPLPESLPSSHMNAIYKTTTDKEKALLSKWYKEDTNALPEPNYVLQPKTRDYLDISYYQENVEKPLLKLFNAYSKELRTEFEKIIFERSATEQEIVEGAFSSQEAQNNAVVYFRTLLDVPINETTTFLETDNPANEQKLRQLKQRLQNTVSPENLIVKESSFHQYNLDDYANSFEEEIYNRLKKTVDYEISSFIEPDDAEVNLHFGNRIMDLFVGRDNELSFIRDYINGEKDSPLVITGESGTGKSTLLAKTHSLLKEISDVNVICKYIGINADYSTGTNILEQIKRELHQLYPEMLDNNEERSITTEEILRMLAGIRSKKDKPLILILDALDQLLPNDTLTSFTWLPNALPAHCTVIFSSLQGEALESLKLKNAKVLDLSGLSKKDATQMLIKGLEKENRTCSPFQLQFINGNLLESDISPLFIRLAISIIKNWHSYQSIFNFPKTIDDIIQQTLDKLSMPENHGILVEKVLSLIRCSRRGLSESEILAILALDRDFVKLLEQISKHDLPQIDGKTIIPPILWARLFSDLQPYFTTRSVAGGTVINLFHRKIWENIDARYLQNSSLKQYNYILLTDYFRDKWKVDNLRSCDELPFLLNKQGNTKELSSLLCNLDFIQKKAEGKLDDDLVKDYEMLLQHCYKINNNLPIKKYANNLTCNRNILPYPNALDRTDEEEKYDDVTKKIMDVRDFVVSEVWEGNAPNHSDYVLNKAANYFEDSFIRNLFEKYEYDNYLINEFKIKKRSKSIMQNRLSFNLGDSPTLSYDGSKVIFIDEDTKRLTIYNVDTQHKERVIMVEGKVLLYDINPTWERMFIVNEEKIIFFDLIQNRSINTINYKSWCDKISFLSIDGHGMKAAVGVENLIYLYDAEDMSFNQITKLNSPIRFGRITSDGQIIYFISSDNEAVKLHIGEKTGTGLTFKNEKGLRISSFATTLDGKTSAIYLGEEIIVIDWEDLYNYVSIPVTEFSYEGSYVKKLYISPDSKYIIGIGHCVHIWSIPDKKSLAYMALYMGEACVTPDFDRLLVREGDNALVHKFTSRMSNYYTKLNTSVWSFSNFKEKTNVRWHNQQNCLSRSANGTTVASFGLTHVEDRVQELILLANDYSGLVVEKIPATSSNYYYTSASNISQDARYLIISQGKNILLIDRESKKQLTFGTKFKDRSDCIIYNNLTKDENCIYTLSGHHIVEVPMEVTLWSIETQKKIRSLILEDWYLSLQNKIQYNTKESSDGRFIILSDSKEFVLLDMENLEHTDVIKTVSGAYLLFCSPFVAFTRKIENRQESILMNLHTKEETKLDFLHDDTIFGLSPDGLSFLVIRDDKLYLKSKGRSVLITNKPSLKFEFTVDSKHLYIENELWSLETLKKVAHYYEDRKGRLPIRLRPCNLKINKVGVVTAVKIWDFIEHCYQDPSADCPFCGKRFIPNPSILNLISQLQSTATNITLPVSMQLDAKAWDDPGLLLNCPHCEKSLRFNPFIY